MGDKSVSLNMGAISVSLSLGAKSVSVNIGAKSVSVNMGAKSVSALLLPKKKGGKITGARKKIGAINSGGKYVFLTVS